MTTPSINKSLQATRDGGFSFVEKSLVGGCRRCGNNTSV